MEPGHRTVLVLVLPRLLTATVRPYGAPGRGYRRIETSTTLVRVRTPNQRLHWDRWNRRPGGRRTPSESITSRAARSQCTLPGIGERVEVDAFRVGFDLRDFPVEFVWGVVDIGIVGGGVLDEFADADGLHAEGLVHHFDGVAACDLSGEIHEATFGEDVQRTTGLEFVRLHAVAGLGGVGGFLVSASRSMSKCPAFPRRTPPKRDSATTRCATRRHHARPPVRHPRQTRVLLHPALAPPMESKIVVDAD
jgi:hypothetical protein